MHRPHTTDETRRDALALQSAGQDARTPSSAHDSPPPRSPLLPSTSLNTPPPRSLTMAPQTPFVVSPAPNMTHRKRSLPRPPTPPAHPQQHSAAEPQTSTPRFSTTSVPGNETLRASTEVCSLVVEAASASSLHDTVAGPREDNEEEKEEEEEEEQHNLLSPQHMTNASTAQAGSAPEETGTQLATRKTTVSSLTSSQRRSMGSTRHWSHSTATSMHRRPDDGSGALSSGVPQLATAHTVVTTNASASTPALTSSFTHGDSIATPREFIVGSGVGEVRDASPLVASPPSVTHTAPTRPSSAGARVHAPPPRSPYASSPPLLPAWVYAFSEHVGPRLPSPPAPSTREAVVDLLLAGLDGAGGGEVATLRVDATDGHALAPSRRLSSLPSSSVLHRTRQHITTTTPSSPVSVVSNVVDSSGHSSGQADRQHRRRPPTSHEADALHVDVRDTAALFSRATSLRPAALWTTYPPQSHRPHPHLPRRDHPPPAVLSSPLAHTVPPVTASQPSLPAFFVAAPRGSDAGLSGLDWRLERAVQLGSSAEDDVGEAERSLASLYAADEMSKLNSTEEFSLV